VGSPKKSALVRLRWLLLAPIPLAWCAVAHLGYLGFLENKTVDWRFRFRGPLESDAKVVYVDVDSISLGPVERGGVGGWPWSREYFAIAAKALIEKAGVKAVGMDFVFSDEGVAEAIDESKLVAGNKALGRYLWKTPQVVVGSSYSAGDFYNLEGKKRIRVFPDISRENLDSLHQRQPPELPSLNIGNSRKVAPPEVAIIDTIESGTRWAWAFAPSSAKTYYTMAIELARIYYGVETDGIKISDDHMDLVRPDASLAARIPLRRKQIIEINWFSPWAAARYNPRVSMSQLLTYYDLLASDKPEERKSAEEFFAQPSFKGAVALIGPTDPLLHDLDPTPVDDVPVPKVSVHGNLFKTITSGLYVRRLPETGAYAAIFGFSFLVCILTLAGGGRAVFAKIMAVLSMGIYVALAFQLFRAGQFVIPVVAPLGSAFTTSFVGLVWQIVEEQKQKGRIKGMFGAYVSPALVERMVDSGEEPRLGGIEENITAYFSDIQSFSSFSEKLSPPRLVELMNEYLTACTDIVQAEGGTLDKYIGDAVVAIYGAPLALPDHPHRACVAALRVHRRCMELRDKWVREGDRWPEVVHRLQTRIGLNTGPAVVGNMGSHTRFNYTMMGDNVNVAARMESGAKSWGVYTMCTDSTRAGSEELEPGRIVFRNLGRITVKGRTQPLPIHELAALKEDGTDRLRECIGIFEQGLERYYARDWDGAIGLFRKSEPLEPNGPGRVVGTHSNPSLVYIGISEAFREEPPPEDWGGVYEMKEK
jgi:adenylate cyclase